MAVYDEMNRVCFEGTEQECVKWIMQFADTLSNGGKLFRSWQSEGFTYYDVGRVYHM